MAVALCLTACSHGTSDSSSLADSQASLADYSKMILGSWTNTDRTCMVQGNDTLEKVPEGLSAYDFLADGTAVLHVGGRSRTFGYETYGDTLRWGNINRRILHVDDTSLVFEEDIHTSLPDTVVVTRIHSDLRRVRRQDNNNI